MFSRFKSLIDRLQWLTENKHFTSRKFLRITGDENEKQREEAKRKFQDPTSEYDLIFLTEAGLEGVNLQQSGTLVCFDLPFSIGKIAQLVGRLLRMSSPHSAVLLHILVSKGTIDEYVIDVLKSKNKVFSLILGESATAGLLDNKEVLDLDSGMEDVKGEEEFKSLLKAFVRNVPMSDFLSGEVLTDAQESSETYQMTFERNNRKKRKVKSPKDEIGKHCDEIELL